MTAEMIERVAKAICREQCAFMGEPPCWQADGLSPDCDEPGCLALAEAAVAAFAEDTKRTPPAAVPDGWIMVPATPTREMIIAHDELQNARGIPAFANSRDIWRAMISAAPAAPNGWQPIETAPKDGTDVLLWDGEEIFVGYWSDSIWVSPGAWVKEEHRSDTVTYIPTHWMPLPAAPTEGRDG